MKINIAICDDNNEVCEHLRLIINNAISGTSYSADITMCISEEELLATGKKFDIAFVEIGINGMKGLDAVYRLKEKSPECKAIIETVMADMWREGYKLNAVKYITKPFSDYEIQEAFKYTLSTIIHEAELPVSYKRKKIYNKQKNIGFILAYNGETQIFVNGVPFRSPMSLHLIMCELDSEEFVQISRQCIVNINKVQSYNDGIILINGNLFNVALRRRQGFETLWIGAAVKD